MIGLHRDASVKRFAKQVGRTEEREWFMTRCWSLVARCSTRATTSNQEQATVLAEQHFNILRAEFFEQAGIGGDQIRHNGLFAFL